MQEQKRLEQILQKATKQLKDAPQGTLRLSNSRKWTQYYYCAPGGKKNGVYIPKKNEKIFLNEHHERQKLIQPIESIDPGGLFSPENDYLSISICNNS